MAEKKNIPNDNNDNINISAGNNEDSFFDNFEDKYSFFADAAAEHEASSIFDEDYIEKDPDGSIDLMSSSSQFDETESKPKKKKHKKKRSKWSAVLHVMLSVFLVGLITASIVIGAFAVYVFVFIDDTVQENLNDLKLDFTTMVYVMDSETGQYVEYQPLHGEFNRKWLYYNKTDAEAEDPEYTGIPQDLCHAFIAIEDETFKTHGGVNWKRTVGAFANMFLDFWSSNQGGSTITQQLVKNLTDDRDQNAMRKVREIMRARYLEQTYSKDTILECYLNTISMAGGMYGVEVAANYYFDKSANDLTITECAALAAIAKEPERYRPDKNPIYNKERRALVLDKMLELGFITNEEYEFALNDELVVVANKENVFNEEDNSYFIDALIEEVIAGLMEKYDMEESYASKHFYNGGYKIYATVDPKIQDVLESEFEDLSHFPESKSTGARPQAAMTIMDYNGHIVATVGGIGEKKGLREYNRATMSSQPPGSSIKPLSVYAPALEYNLITYSTLYNDEPIDFGGWSPRNAYTGFKGIMPISKAVELSCNTIAVQTLQDLSLSTSYDYITNRLGITTLFRDSSKDFNYSSLALGGSFQGITVTESTAAYATFGNLGRYYKPTTFVKVTDQHDKVILSYDAIPTLAMSEDTATIMNKILQGVIYGADGTATRLADFSSNLKAFGKTGTTSSYFDRWFVGGTPYYVGGCWFGFDENEKITNSKEVLVIWENVMSKIHSGLPDKDFPTSQFVTRRKYCTETGALATAACPVTEVGYYKTSYLPTCALHRGQMSEAVPDPDPNASSSGVESSGTTSGETTSEIVSSETEVSSTPDTNETVSVPSDVATTTPVEEPSSSAVESVADTTTN